ncbi:MAG TPA: IS1380 family transposase [Acidobacteriota bacterium]|nr:IS1380 family transposase [Acidobacteriota bacterium]
MKQDNRTQCHRLERLGRRRVEADFQGGRLTSDGGVLLLREVESRFGVIEGFSRCFEDHREQSQVEFSVPELVGQRVFGLALGYEDVNDHDDLRRDPLLAVAVGREDAEGQRRSLERDRGAGLAGKSTLNRLELSAAEAGGRYRRTSLDFERAADWLTELYVRCRQQEPEELILDIDATDVLLHGDQEGRFFHGFYGDYCYLPLYIFCEGFVLCARLRPSNIDASAGAEEDLERVIGRLRRAWPEVRIVVRGDSGFCREGLMSWCEENGVEYVFGLAKNARLKRMAEPALEQARERHEHSGCSERVLDEASYKTRKSWSRRRRVVIRADYNERGANPRFVVTSLDPGHWPAKALYEQLYCARCDAENRIKEQQLELFADRTSTRLMRSNQLRLWFSALAYSLIHLLRVKALQGSRLAKAQCSTIRLRLFKIGAQIRISVRRVLVSMASGHPGQRLFAHALARLRAG